MKAAVVLAALALASSPARADDPDPDPIQQRHRLTRILAFTAGAAVYFASELVFKDALAAETCGWCAPPGFDRAIRNRLVWDDVERARALSNFIGYVGVPLVDIGWFLLSTSSVVEGRALVVIDDAIAIGEAAVYTSLVTQLVKFTARRQRPYAQFAEEGTLAPGNDDNVSFISGHSSYAFAIAVGAGWVAHRRGYKYEAAIWATGLTLASATAYLRIAGDKHYFSDVVLGSLAGAAGGLVIPWLTGSLPGRLAVVPTGKGLALAGSF